LEKNTNIINFKITFNFARTIRKLQQIIIFLRLSDCEELVEVTWRLSDCEELVEVTWRVSYCEELVGEG